MKRLWIFSIVCFIIHSGNAQINISMNDSCSMKNSILLVKELIRTFGRDKISEFLDNDIRLILFFSTDSLGNMTVYKSIIRKNDPNDSSSNTIEKLKSDLNLNLKIKKGCLNICYERLPDSSDSASVALISKDLFKDRKNILFNVAFPGDLLKYYELEKEKSIKEGKNLTKYEYLEFQILNSH